VPRTDPLEFCACIRLASKTPDTAAINTLAIIARLSMILPRFGLEVFRVSDRVVGGDLGPDQRSLLEGDNLLPAMVVNDPKPTARREEKKN
jgi:hypothetical protein